MQRFPTVESVFDPRRNGLNVLRLVLAVSVILWHSVGITGGDIGYAPARQLVSRVSVDSFFAISGFLIYSSWVRRPQWRSYMRSRALRIFPAYWVCIVVTAYAIAPLALVLQGSVVQGSYPTEAIEYIVRNAGLWVFQYDIAGTPLGTPIEGAWNGSIWTLAWEFICYLGILVLGVVGLLRRPATVPATLALMVVAVLATSYGPVDNFYVTTGARFGIMFVAGMMVFKYQRHIPVRPALLAGAVVVVLLSAWLPDYRLIAALPLAYLMISAGALIKHERLHIRNDLSYGTYIYAFPLQQLLAMAGGTDLPLIVFMTASVALTLPLAAVSWFWIERPLLRLKSRGPRVANRVVGAGSSG